jgi:hypothetical protein
MQPTLQKNNPSFQKLKILHFIQQYGLQALEKEFSIFVTKETLPEKVQKNEEQKSLILLSYDRLNSPTEHNIVQECFGLILEEKKLDLNENNNQNIAYHPVAFSYFKFFSYDTKEAAKIDWNSARVYERIDGYIAILYYYQNSWFVGSRVKIENQNTKIKSNSFFLF